MHLLKASSKPVPQQRKRRKVDLCGTPSQWMHHVAEVNSQNASQAQSAHPSQRKEEVKKDFSTAVQMPHDPQANELTPMASRRQRGNSKERQQVRQ